MLKHKVGEIVTLNSKVDGDLQGNFRPGVQVKIENLCDKFPCPSDNHYTVRLVSNSNEVWWIKDSEIEEPKQMFNIKTDPWFIRINSEQEFNVIQDWLEENYGCSLITSYNPAIEYLTNTSCTGQSEEAFVMHGRGNPLKTPSRKEIKLTFKTTIDSVQYPEMETEQQIKMKQLQETIDRAARELKELREMGEKK